jgi:hypothetical protein
MFEVEEEFMGKDVTDPAVREAARARIRGVIDAYRAP